VWTKELSLLVLIGIVSNQHWHHWFQDAQSTDTNPQLDGNRTQNGDVCDTSHRHPVPETLEYLDSMCPHVRLTCLVHSLQSANDHSHNVVTLLTDLAAKYHLDRLWRIVDETIARG